MPANQNHPDHEIMSANNNQNGIKKKSTKVGKNL